MLAFGGTHQSRFKCQLHLWMTYRRPSGAPNILIGMTPSESIVLHNYFLSVALLKLLVQAARRKLPDGKPGRETGRGVIIITSSCASLHNSTNIDLTSHATSKAGLDHLVALLATKFAPWYVRVNSINPGLVPSKMNPVEDDGNQFVDLFAKMPAKRIGRMEDIAGTVLWLCSQAGSYVDGRSICVDGGRVLLANGQ
jgi:NAD(P)-dependent dehydrogenase (short-subunit alcohol dehydrogenase family)